MATPKSDNTRIWDALGKTDPAHTKQFTRAGGFKGTAIKPMWANKQMTEFFGPCGVGWGMEQPMFNVVPALDEIMVFCTVGLWYVQSARSQTVYGVGGDKVVVKQSSGLRTDDEAFKKAYTDALGNAMKFIGVGADVHMGQFDDNKYVQEVRNEFEEAKKAVQAAVEEDNAQLTPKYKELRAEIVTKRSTFEFDAESMILHCTPVEVKKAPKGFISVKLNQSLFDKDVANYFHKSHQDELLKTAGKVCTFLMSTSGKDGKTYLNIDAVLEIDGKKVDNGKRTVTDVELSTELKAESDARLLGSYLEFSEEELREAFSTVGKGSWTKTFQLLKDEKARREA